MVLETLSLSLWRLYMCQPVTAHGENSCTWVLCGGVCGVGGGVCVWVGLGVGVCVGVCAR